MENSTIIGFIGRNAEVAVKNDLFEINFSVACTKKWFDKNTGEEKERTTWYSIFKRSKKDPANMLPYLTQGIKVYISGTPTFSIDQHQSSMRVGIIINAEKLEILTFKEKKDV